MYTNEVGHICTLYTFSLTIQYAMKVAHQSAWSPCMHSIEKQEF